jgi:hypothetical protein
MDTFNPAVIDCVFSCSPPTEAKRRHHSPELKRQIVEEARASVASVARVAQANGVNANQAFAWRRQDHQGLMGSEKRGTPGLLAVRGFHLAGHRWRGLVDAGAAFHAAGRD